MSFRTQFTDSEWQTLQRAPVWAFIMTAASDGKVDPKEVKAFAKELAESLLYKDELAREVFASVATDLAEVLPGCLKDPAVVLGGLQSAGKLLDSKAGGNAEGFKRAVLLICKNVAEAAGGRLFGGGKISDNEKAAMVVVASALGAKL